MQYRDGRRPSNARETILEGYLQSAEAASREFKQRNISPLKIPKTQETLVKQQHYLVKQNTIETTQTKEKKQLSEVPLEKQLSEEDSDEKYIKKKIPLFLEMIQAIKFKFMAHRLLSSTRSYMYKNLTTRQFKQIDDKAWSPEQTKREVKENKLSKKHMSFKDSFHRASSGSTNHESSLLAAKRSVIGRFLSLFEGSWVTRLTLYLDKQLPVIEPTSLRKIIWDFISVLGMLIYAIQLPLFITFSENYQSITHWVIIMSVPVFFLFDLIFCLNTGCYHKGCLIKKRNQLLRINFYKVILPNIAIISAYTLFISIKYASRNDSQEGNRQWLNILLATVIMKLQDFGTIVVKLQEHSILTKKYRNIISLLKLILTIVYIGHLIACLWINVAQLEVNQNKLTWLKQDPSKIMEWYTLYINSFYFTMVTMTTVGYGDYVPVNEVERTVSVFIIVFSSGVFAYSMNTIGSILQSFNEDNVKKTRNMSIINAYMTRKNVSTLMKNSIREYLDFYWQEESERDQEAEEKIINLLSDNLKKNLLVESKNVVLKKSAIFRNNFSDVVKEKIAPLIREYRCSPEEIICLEGEQDDCSIYFIEKGSVEIFIESNSLKQGLKTIASLGKGSSFGELSFFTGKARSANIRSREFTTLLILNRQEFLQVLVNYKDDYEKFCMLRDSLDFYQNYSLINLSCLSCQSVSHQIYKCPYSHYQANLSRLRQLFFFCPNQERSKCERKQFSRSNSRFNRNTVKDIAESYQGEHDESIEYLNWQALEKENANFSNSENKNSEEDEEIMNNKHANNNNNNGLSNELFNVNVNYYSPQNSTQDEKYEKNPFEEGMNRNMHEDEMHNELKEMLKMKKMESNQSQKDFTIPEEDEGDGNEEACQDRFCFDSRTPMNNSNISNNFFNFQNVNSPKEMTKSQSEDKTFGQRINQRQNSLLIPSSNVLERTPRRDAHSTWKKEDIMTPMRKQEKKQSNKLLLQISGKRIEALRAALGNTQNQQPHTHESGIGMVHSPKLPVLTRSNGKNSTFVRNNKKMTFFNKTKGISGIAGFGSSSSNSNSCSNISTNCNKELRYSETKLSDLRNQQHQNIPMIEGLGFEEDYEKMLKVEQQAATEYVERNFDVMQNFVNYFPLNNVDYQIELLGMTKEEKRRKMIWNSYNTTSAVRTAQQKAREYHKKKLTIFNQNSNNMGQQTIEERRKSRFGGSPKQSKKLVSQSTYTFIQNSKLEKEDEVDTCQQQTTLQSINHPMSLTVIDSSKRLTYQFSKRNTLKTDTESIKSSNKNSIHQQQQQPSPQPFSLNSISMIKLKETLFPVVNAHQVSSAENSNFVSFNQATLNHGDRQHQEDIYPSQSIIHHDSSFLDSLISSKVSNPIGHPFLEDSNEFNLRSKRVAYRLQDDNYANMLPADDSRQGELYDNEFDMSQVSVSLREMQLERK